MPTQLIKLAKLPILHQSLTAAAKVIVSGQGILFGAEASALELGAIDVRVDHIAIRGGRDVDNNGADSGEEHRETVFGVE